MLAQVAGSVAHPYKQVRDQLGVVLCEVLQALYHPTRYAPLEYPAEVESFVDNLVAQLGACLGTGTVGCATRGLTLPVVKVLPRARARGGTRGAPPGAAAGGARQSDRLRAHQQDRYCACATPARSPSRAELANVACECRLSRGLSPAAQS